MRLLTVLLIAGAPVWAAEPAAAPKAADTAKTDTVKADSAKGGADAPKTEEQKTMYTLGFFLGNKAGPLSITPAEMKWVSAGFKDGAGNKKPVVNLDEYGPKVNDLANARTAKAREAAAAQEAKGAQARKDAEKSFLDKAAAEKGAQRMPSGLIFKELKAGTGAKPKAEDTVKVHYEGKLVDGTVFDSSIARGEPATFPLNGVIPCWTEAVQKLKVGGKAQLTCPPSIAYGDSGRPPVIPAGATLVFQVELLDIVKK